MKYYKIKNWDLFQTRSHRRPPWVKIYREILESKDWIMGNPTDRNLILICIILASEESDPHWGCIVDDAEMIQRRGRLYKKPNLLKLVKSGFLIEYDDTMSSSCRQNVSLEFRVQNKKQNRVDSITRSFEENKKIAQQKAAYLLTQEVAKSL